jgi:hypothetical protein
MYGKAIFQFPTFIHSFCHSILQLFPNLKHFLAKAYMVFGLRIFLILFFCGFSDANAQTVGVSTGTFYSG